MQSFLIGLFGLTNLSQVYSLQIFSKHKSDYLISSFKLVKGLPILLKRTIPPDLHGLACSFTLYHTLPTPPPTPGPQRHTLLSIPQNCQAIPFFRASIHPFSSPFTYLALTHPSALKSRVSNQESPSQGYHP